MFTEVLIMAQPLTISISHYTNPSDILTTSPSYVKKFDHTSDLGKGFQYRETRSVKQFRDYLMLNKTRLFPGGEVYVKAKASCKRLVSY